MVFNHFQDTAALPFPRFGVRMLAAELRQAQGIAHVVLHFEREGLIVLLGRADPMQGLLSGRAIWVASHVDIYQDRYTMSRSNMQAATAGDPR